MEWYSLRVISGKEKSIREAILFEVSHSDHSKMVEDVFVPTENIVEMKEGKKKVRERVFFPGYLLVKMEMTKEAKVSVVKREFKPGFTLKDTIKVARKDTKRGKTGKETR